MRSRRRSRPEDAIQRAVLTHLAVRCASKVFWFHVPNGGKRKPIEAAVMKGLGVVAGVPDLIIIHDGKTYGLELKSDEGSLSDNQIVTQQRMRDAGAFCETVYGLDAALKWLESHKILLGKTT